MRRSYRPPRLVHAAAASALVSACVLALTWAGCGPTEEAALPDSSAPPQATGSSVPSAPRPPRDSAPPPIVAPKLLSETGLYANFGGRTLAPEVVPYTVRFPLWSDGAELGRYLLLPRGTTIDTSVMDQWVFPVGTKAWIEFRVGGKLVETRFLWKQGAEQGVTGPPRWWMAAYVWRADGTDADVTLEEAPAATTADYQVPSQLACQICHGEVRDALAGVGAIQLSSASGESSLRRLMNAGRLSHPPAAEPRPPGEGVVQEALGYLHGNCAHCHSDLATRLATQSDMRLGLRVTDKVPEDTLAYKTTIGVKMKHVLPPDIDVAVVPGDPDRSELWRRMSVRDFWAMPPLGTKTVDPTGTRAVREWILGLR